MCPGSPLRMTRRPTHWGKAEASWSLMITPVFLGDVDRLKPVWATVGSGVVGATLCLVPGVSRPGLGMLVILGEKWVRPGAGLSHALHTEPFPGLVRHVRCGFST